MQVVGACCSLTVFECLQLLGRHGRSNGAFEAFYAVADCPILLSHHEFEPRETSIHRIVRQNNPILHAISRARSWSH
jgi:hypothetical protein